MAIPTEKMTEKERTQAYESLLLEHGPNYMGVGWKPEECLGQYASIRRLLGISPSDTVLDVGCGIGYGFNVFHDCNFTGIDVSHTHTSAAKHIFAGSGARFHNRRLEEEIPEGKYDYCLLSGIFNIGYEWKEAAHITTLAYEKSAKGIGVGFQIDRHEGFTTFGIQTWIGLMTKLSGRKTGWAADTTFSKINGVVVATKEMRDE